MDKAAFPPEAGDEAYRLTSPALRPDTLSLAPLAPNAILVISLLMTGLIVLLKQIPTKIAGEVTPHRVDVVSMILCVIEFDKK